MLVRSFRVLLSFVAIFVTYCLYALTVVPFVEPEEANRPTTRLDTSADGESFDEQIERLRPFFPEGSPELDKPTILENPQFTLLFKDYETINDHELRINPCTIVFFPDGAQKKTTINSRRIIMRASEGAILHFPDGVDPRRLKLGKFESGRLAGKVTIEGDLGSPSSNQESTAPSEGHLLIETSDVQMTQKVITTPREVTFEYGSNRGRGRDLRIELADDKIDRKQTFKSLRLAHDVQLRLDVGQNKSLLPGGTSPIKTAAAETPEKSSADKEEPATHVEVTCAGAFRFDAIDLVATFEDKVDVVRISEDGPVDQLACELLALYMARPEKETTPVDPNSSEPTANITQPKAKRKSVEVIRIEAHGAPVIAQRPSEKARLRCEQLIYHLESRELSLDGDVPVTLQHGENHVEAESVRYKPGENGSIGEIVAAGKGQLHAVLPDQPDTHLDAKWNNQLRLEPYEGQTLLSVLGDAEVRYGDTGTLLSKNIWLRLIEQPGEKRDKASRYAPHSMSAEGNVRIDSPQMVGKTDKLQMWFTPVASPVKAPTKAHVVSTAPTPPKANRPPFVTTSPTNGSSTKPKSRYQIDGKLVRVQLAMHENKTSLRNVEISGNVQLTEIVTAKPNEAPLSLRGDRLQLSNADSTKTTLAVTGPNALVKARGLALSGTNIQLDKASNRMWIDGAGWMSLPMSRDLAGKKAQGGPPLRIVWKGRMVFDGRTVKFERDVEASTQRQRLSTSRLAVTLTQDVDFAQPSDIGKTGGQRDIDVQRVDCAEGVFLESRTITDGQITSIDKIAARDLTFEQKSGNLLANGPGWISSIRRGAQADFDPQKPKAPAAGAKKKDGLSFIGIEFQGRITGNLHQKQVALNDQVQGIFGPVVRWEDELDLHGIEELRPNDVRFSCDKLNVTELGTVASKRNIELEALGNARVDGQVFSAMGNRISYAAGKELLVLKGTPQRDAELWYEKKIGAGKSHAAAQEILYWRNSSRVQVNGARLLDLNQIGGPR